MELAQKIMNAVAKMGSIYGRNLSPAALQRWAEKLSPHAQKPHFWRVLDDACDGGRMPSINEVIETLVSWRGQSSGSVQFDRPERSNRSDQACILSLLWLHYSSGWSLYDLSGHVLARMYPGDVAKALEAACSIYTPEMVKRWMEDQQRAGN